MSQQPRQVPTHSSSPSKSTSRRTTSGGGTTSVQPLQQQTTTTTNNAAVTRGLLPSPHFEDDPIVASHQQHRQRPSLTLNDPEYSEHAVAESEHYGHGLPSAHTDQDIETIPSFQPFFTLIEDSVTNEHHHPTVHYIFADDDADIIAEAALRSLETLDPTQRVGQSSTAEQGRGHPRKEAEARPSRMQNEEDSLNASRLPHITAGVQEHYVILDVHPQPQAPVQTVKSDDNSPAVPSTYSYEVISAHSLSAEWQVLRTSISAAPTIGDNPPAGDEGLMLRIEGRGNTPGDVASAKEKGKETEGERDKGKESMEEMIERFQRRLEDIRMVMDAGPLAEPTAAEEE